MKITSHSEIVDRLQAYVEETKTGQLIDLKAATTDIIVLMKADNVDRDTFLYGVARLWDEIDIQVIEGRLQ